MSKCLTLSACCLVLSAVAARAQMVTDYNPPKANCCLPSAAHNLAEQLLDWNQLGRYHADDERLKSAPVVPGRVVFMGDSITDGWNLARYFPGKPYVNRGISGQTTSQMLVRMFPDVIDLHPAVMIVLAGTNDIAQNTGPETATMIEENFEAMTELAQKHGIKVVLCALTPVSDYTASKQTEHRPPVQIRELNQWIREYSEKSRALFCDYYSAVLDDKGFLREGYSNDGLHPNDKGYQLMVPVAEGAIEKALGSGK